MYAFYLLRAFGQGPVFGCEMVEEKWAFEKLDLDSWKVYTYLRVEKGNKT